MTWSGDYSNLDLSKLKFLVLLELMELKIGTFSFRTRTHDDGDLELSMSRNEVSMIVSQGNIFEGGVSFLNELIEK